MKKLITLTIILSAFTTFIKGQSCNATVNVLSAKVETNGGTGFEFKIAADPNVNFYAVQLKKKSATNWQTVQTCVGSRHYSPNDDHYTVTITKAGAAAYGYAKGDDVRVLPYCGGILSYQDCINSSSYGIPSATYTLKFKGN